MSMAVGTFPADDVLAPRVDAFRRAQAHSRVVRVMKLVFPLLAVLVSVGFGAAAWRAAPAEPAIAAEDAAVADGKLIMANPTLGGVTDDDQPYSMMASRAIQAIGVENIVELEAINASLPMNGEDVATLVAAGGTYDRDANTLVLKAPEGGTIDITTTNGMTAKARAATVHISDGSMDAQGDVAVTTPEAVLTSDTLAVREGGEILIFERNVRMTIEPGGLGASDDGDGDENL
ncbi:MAG TPA: LPS export ABC transporter periplasmic protein LptC [Mesorhizobium sp.]|jgi:lipopolysaccharide export system protein LptC|nr:LPS export ABC transporter periplasmic protein LptC [Mesorhizobium sp.]